MSGIDRAFWTWEYPDATKHYMVAADVARGDSSDYSAFHVIDIESMTQVAEYKAQCDTREYAKILLRTAIDYNNALLVVENANIGWDVIKSLQESGYNNLHFSYSNEFNSDLNKYIDVQNRGSNLVPGFTMSQKTRPLAVEKMRDFVENKLVNIKSVRLLEELKVFIWKNGKAQGMNGYNDDLVMAFAMAMFLRETSLRFKKTADSLTSAALNGFAKVDSGYVQNPYSHMENPWSMTYQTGQGQQAEDLTWLI